MNVLAIHRVVKITGRRTIHEDFSVLKFEATDDDGNVTEVQFYMDTPIEIDFKQTDTDRSYE